MHYGGSDPRCEKGTEVMVDALKVGTAFLAGGAALAFLSKGEAVNAADGRPRLDPGSAGKSQAAMERYQTDLPELRRQGAITEAQ